MPEKALQQAELKLKVEQTKFVSGASVARFVSAEQRNVAQAQIERTALELAASTKLIRAERILTTDAAGGFVLDGLAPGGYVIQAFRDGFEPSRLTFVEVKSGLDVKADVTIRPF